MIKKPLHNFHIPVMGLAYTIDSPIRVAQYGISSVVSIIDDEIIEKMKNFYSSKFNLNYVSISTRVEDYRAKRITAYLDMLDDIVTEKFEAFKEEISKSGLKTESGIFGADMKVSLINDGPVTIVMDSVTKA